MTWLAAAAALSPPAAPAVADQRARQLYVAEAASRFGLPEQWIHQVIRLESGGRLTIAGKPVVSRAGAMGLMQLMPATWREMRLRLHLGTDPFEPHDNIIAGAGYLRAMYDRFGYPAMFAAYNAGPKRYVAYVAGAPLPAETRKYVAAAVDMRRAPDRRSASFTQAGAPVAPLFPSAAQQPLLFAIVADSAAR